ncbi:hypothetical protein [Paenibacillus endoradicis]|uniref:hypothetical protein n=1 Tax=Paenibacillus endoradicis TaxID=2972487 RepID=UPI002159B2B0|nr:hypothetical protein [Paenibacillus endoradicis]MCR8656895.1 hypothetical protein [Paenibacillus endoradicis]
MKKIVVCSVATFLITVLMIILMVQLFPYTGLGRLITIPMTIVVNLAIPIETHDVEKLSPDKQTPQEYIVALHKFRDEIPLNGSFVLDGGVDKYGVDPAIRNIEEISDKLVGHYEILWLYLEKFK